MYLSFFGVIFRASTAVTGEETAHLGHTRAASAHPRRPLPAIPLSAEKHCKHSQLFFLP